jgi:hypothetical protein
MNVFGFTPDQVAARIRSAGGNWPSLNLGQSIGFGAVGFGLVSLLVFATVAFGERWMYRNLGLTGAYVCWTLLFILAGGGALSRLVIGPGRLARFYLLFSVAFLAYALGWVAAYFTMPDNKGEWLGSLAGSVLMGVILAWAFGALQEALKIIAFLFVANSIGYFLGSFLNTELRGKTGMLAWGIAFGLGLGAGLGASLYFAQAPVRERIGSFR